MPHLSEVIAALDRLAPPRFALGFDKVGLQVSPVTPQITSLVFSLDRSLAAVDLAVEIDAGLLVTHHPLIFRPIERIGDDYEGRAIRKLIGHGIGHFAAHTNWDAAQGGINDALAKRFGLLDVASFGMAMEVERLKLVTFAPPEAVEAILDAASAAGAGVIGSYSRCGFGSPGTGRYESSSGSHPSVEEIRLEMVLPVGLRSSVDRAVRAVHPYETPAINYFLLAGDKEQALGRVGRLETPISLEELVVQADSLLGTRSLAWGDPGSPVAKVAVEGGAADGDWRAARRAGADVLITGEVKQHVALEASESGFALIQAGHYATEQPGVEDLALAIARELPGVAVEVFAPEAGASGRPFFR